MPQETPVPKSRNAPYTIEQFRKAWKNAGFCGINEACSFSDVAGLLTNPALHLLGVSQQAPVLEALRGLQLTVRLDLNGEVQSDEQIKNTIHAQFVAAAESALRKKTNDPGASLTSGMHGDLKRLAAFYVPIARTFAEIHRDADLGSGWQIRLTNKDHPHGKEPDRHVDKATLLSAVALQPEADSSRRRRFHSAGTIARMKLPNGNEVDVITGSGGTYVWRSETPVQPRGKFSSARKFFADSLFAALVHGIPSIGQARALGYKLDDWLDRLPPKTDTRRVLAAFLEYKA